LRAGAGLSSQQLSGSGWTGAALGTRAGLIAAKACEQPEPEYF
jgi:hypothetical protein